MTLITTAHHKRRSWGRVRGTIAVAMLLLTAFGALLSAVTGWPITRAARRFAAPFAAAWRAAAWRTIPAVPIVIIRTAAASEGSRDHGRNT